VVFEIAIFWLGFRLLRHYRLTSLLIFTFFAAALRWSILAAFPESVLLVWGAQVLHAVTYGLHHSVMMQLIDQFFQGRYQVRGQALYISVSFGVGGAFGSLVSGYIWTGFGANFLFYSAGGLMMVAALAALFLLRHRTEQLPIREL
jgi:PPP family 3-phenylpropionic acid transporter